MTQQHNLSADDCRNLDDYTRKFWDALLPVESYRVVTFRERVEKYCCRLPKELRDYCTKTKVPNMTQFD